MHLCILGGGLSAITAALFLQEKDTISKITILEKEEKAGGLCRTFKTNGIEWDVGPHIIFSKDKEVLDFMNKCLGCNNQQHRRSNRIIHDKRFVQYPFENDLSKLSDKDKFICLNGFLHNPYENYSPSNMLQFFLSTFGEGITNLYLRPYNEKIWKFDPSFMDTQMVERIPRPPKEDIIKSAAGTTVDGYTHQLYFNYPKFGGTEALIKSLINKFSNKVELITNAEVESVKKCGNAFVINASGHSYSADKIISTIPLGRFVDIYSSETNKVPDSVRNAGSALRHNSIAICIVNVKHDFAGDNYAFMIADRDVIFHRISKLDFMGSGYHINNSVTYMAEVTYRSNDIYDKMSDDHLKCQVVEGLQKIGFIQSIDDVNFAEVKRFDYSYVIYDLMHKHNTALIKEYLSTEGVETNGRFGTFEYLNMDAVIRQSMILAAKF